MNRRAFLKGLLGTTALAALPISLVPSAFASGGVIPVTVQFHVAEPICGLRDWATTFKMYSAFEEKLEVIAPDTYLFKLNTREFTK